MKFMLALVITSGLLAAAPSFAPVYRAMTFKTSVSSTRLTISQPSRLQRALTVSSVIVTCSGAGTFSLIRNGTAPTATAGIVAAMSPESVESRVSVWENSDSTGGVTLLTLPCSAQPTTINVLGLKLSSAGATQNASVLVTANSGTIDARAILVWTE